MTSAAAWAKLNLALVVGPARPDGKHEVVTVLQRIDLGDRISLGPAPELRVDGFAGDTLVEQALRALGRTAGVEPRWAVRIEKRIPVAAGLGGGSSDAATALALANATLPSPLPQERLERLGATLGADVPFFLRRGPQLGTGDGSTLEPLRLPQGYWVVVLLPRGEVKESTAAVYRRFDERRGEEGFEARAAALAEALPRVRRPRDLAGLPPNDLASSPLTGLLERHGAVRGDVSGAGSAVYGLFLRAQHADAAAAALRPLGRTWVAQPRW